MKLPSVWWCGVRVTEITQEKVEVSVKHRWANQNPFRSMFWAVQGMAAELATGVLVMRAIAQSGYKISMLVAQNKAVFSKKATGRIRFVCRQGSALQPHIDKAVATGEGQVFWLQSVGTDEQGEIVSIFDFEWTIRLKKQS